MSDEIKEILDFKENADYKRLSVDEITILKDYITKLQEENKKLKEIIKDNIILVKDENGNYQECSINPLDYKSRCEKAIEYIKQYTDKLKTIRVPKIDFNYNNLLNILTGGDK